LLQKKSRQWAFPEKIASEVSDVFCLGKCFLYFLQQVLNVNFGFGEPTNVSLHRQLEYLRTVVKGKTVLEFLTTILCQMVAIQPECRPSLDALCQQLEKYQSKSVHAIRKIKMQNEFGDDIAKLESPM
jgi:hypothetical protein